MLSPTRRRLVARRVASALVAGAVALAVRTASPVTADPAAGGSVAAGVRPPPPPAAGPGSLAARFPSVVEEVVRNPANPSKSVHLFRPVAGPDAPLPVKAPVVLFLHGFGAMNASPYRLWIEHMARHGCLVVVPIYASIEAPGGLSRYDTMWSGFEEGLRRLEATRPAPDTTRIGVVGHSFGGGAAPAIAARAVARGYGATGLFVESWAPWYDLDRDAWSGIPAHAFVLSVGFDGDSICDAAMAASFPARATNVPAARKGFRFVRSDAHGAPTLSANHRTPLADGSFDGMDTHVVWRLDDALRARAFDGDAAAGESALGATTDALSLGVWSDGVAVLPLLDAIPEPSPGASRRTRATWCEGGTLETSMRRVFGAETFSTLPLPPPALVPPARLPRAERLLAEPPADVPATAPGATTLFLAPESVLASEGVARLEAAGVAVVRAKPGTSFADALRRDGTSTALLVGGDRSVRLWKRVDDPALVAAVLALAK